MPLMVKTYSYAFGIYKEAALFYYQRAALRSSIGRSSQANSIY